MAYTTNSVRIYKCGCPSVMTHSLVLQPTTFAKAALVSHQQPKRLIVFVHGFWGDAFNSWTGITEFDASNEFWRDADLIFFGYGSFKESIKGVADRFRRQLGEHYPVPHPDLYRNAGGELRDGSEAVYSELYIAAHSLGAVVVRRAALDDLVEWDAEGAGFSPPVTLEAQIRLFSPASAGFRPANLLGLIRATAIWPAIEMILRLSSSYADLRPDSAFLSSTRRRTEQLSEHPYGSALRARMLWANPENIVIAECYDSDVYSQSVDGRTHVDVVKPSSTYSTPWSFIESGRL